MEKLKCFLVFWALLSVCLGGIAAICFTLFWLGVLSREIHPTYGPVVLITLITTGGIAAMMALTSDEKVG
jgi:hypothetical protein